MTSDHGTITVKVDMSHLEALCERLETAIQDGRAAENRLRKLLRFLPLDPAVTEECRAAFGLEPVGMDADGSIKPITKLAVRAEFAMGEQARVEICTDCGGTVPMCDDCPMGECPGKVNRDRKRVCIVAMVDDGTWNNIDELIAALKLPGGCEVVQAAINVDGFMIDEVAVKIWHPNLPRVGVCAVIPRMTLDELRAAVGEAPERSYLEQKIAESFNRGTFGEPVTFSGVPVYENGKPLLAAEPVSQNCDKSEGDDMADFFKRSTHDR